MKVSELFTGCFICYIIPNMMTKIFFNKTVSNKSKYISNMHFCLDLQANRSRNAQSSNKYKPQKWSKSRSVKFTRW